MEQKINVIIANYVGFTFETNLGWYDNDGILPQHVLDNNQGNCFDNLHFHESADWVLSALQVVENRTGQGLVIYPESCYWNDFGDNILEDEFSGDDRTRMVFNALFALINYFNKKG